MRTLGRVIGGLILLVVAVGVLWVIPGVSPNPSGIRFAEVAEVEPADQNDEVEEVGEAEEPADQNDEVEEVGEAEDGETIEDSDDTGELTLSNWDPVIEESQALSETARLRENVCEGTPGHADDDENTNCVYWLPPEALVSSDTGPNPSGEEVAQNVYEYTSDQVRANAKGRGTTLVLEGVLVHVVFNDGTERTFRPSAGFDGVLVVVKTSKVSRFRINDGSWHAIRSPEDVDIFLTVRIAHLQCRCVENEVRDLR